MKALVLILSLLSLNSVFAGVNQAQYVCGKKVKKAYVTVEKTHHNLPLISVEVVLEDFVGNTETQWEVHALAQKISNCVYRLDSKVTVHFDKKGNLSLVNKTNFQHPEMSVTEQYYDCQKL